MAFYDTDNICNRFGATSYWHAEFGGSTEISAKRRGNTIELRGRFKGEYVDRSIRIDERPWFQPLSYSLRSLSESSAPVTVRFWTIRADTLELVNMEAEVQGIESIQISGKDVEALRVEIRKSGYLSIFWSADYWFRTRDHIFVQYRGTHGLPGTPETLITLYKQDHGYQNGLSRNKYQEKENEDEL